MLHIVFTSSSTKTLTASTSYSLATLDVSMAVDNETERFELDQIIVSMKLAPASASNAASFPL